MRYRITHATSYAYAEPVPLGHNVARLRPRDTAAQRCLRFEFSVAPSPAWRRDRIDFFGNHAIHFSLQEPHDGLSATAVSEVELAPPEPPSSSAPWEEALGRPDLRAFTFASPFVDPSPGLADYARPSFPPGRPLHQAALDLTARIHADFRYVPGATAVGTPAAEVMRTREGVCQDFAHLEIGCLRALGLAARYVSGYALTDPPPGQDRVPGVDASHAWLAVALPGAGWVDLDPTRGGIPAGTHVTIGWARDYGDLPPLKGVLLGGRGQSLKVSVDMVPLNP